MFKRQPYQTLENIKTTFKKQPELSKKSTNFQAVEG